MSDEPVLRDGDFVYVEVFNQEPLSTHEQVRVDGKISVPVVGEITARDKRPSQVAAEIQERLKNVVVAPAVRVKVEAGPSKPLSRDELLRKVEELRGEPP